MFTLTVVMLRARDLVRLSLVLEPSRQKASCNSSGSSKKASMGHCVNILLKVARFELHEAQMYFSAHSNLHLLQIFVSVTIANCDVVGSSLTFCFSSSVLCSLVSVSFSSSASCASSAFSWGTCVCLKFANADGPHQMRAVVTARSCIE